MLPESDDSLYGWSMSRPYRGRTSDERLVERRRRLVRSGMRLVGDGGVSALTMRAVCRDAELSPRFFYESFTDVEDLLREVYRETFYTMRAAIDDVADREVGTEAKVRAGVDVAARRVRDDPRICRILLIEPVADLGLRQFVREHIMEMLPTVLLPRSTGDPLRAKMRYATVFGAMISLFLEWTEGNLGDDRAVFVDHVIATVLRV